MTTEEKIKIMQAFIDGEEIEIASKTRGWELLISEDPVWDWFNSNFRIKPKEKERLYLWAFKGKSSWIIDDSFSKEKPEDEFKHEKVKADKDGNIYIEV